MSKRVMLTWIFVFICLLWIQSAECVADAGVTVSSIGQSIRHNKQIVGYYPNWQWYRRNQLVDAEAIQYEKYTVINYAFFRPMSDGSIVSTDSWADENLLLGPMIWWPVVMHDSTRSMPYLAAQAGTKLLPSIGGWNDSYNFPGIAADPVKRQTFVQDCLSLIQTYGFNGIDLDWEYPGYAPNGGTTADMQNFTLLLQSLRDALDALEFQTGEAYIISSCFSAAQSQMANIDWLNVLPLVDMVNLMTYDYHGPWDTLSNHNAPLYQPLVGDPDWSCDGSFNILTDVYGVPPSKINMGIAFYGKALSNCTQLYGTHSGYDTATFAEDEGQPHYYNILNSIGSFTSYWDEQVKCPYLLGNTINTFVSYDNEESVQFKARYLKHQQAQGVIIWEITGDYVETAPGSGVIAGTPLLDSLIEIFNLPEAILAPENLTIGLVNGIVELSWDVVSGATSYKIYHANSPLPPGDPGWSLVGETALPLFQMLPSALREFIFISSAN